MKKFAALDLGDKWVGVATADPMGIVTTPITTVELKNLYSFLSHFIAQEIIGTIIVGLPTTLRGTESEQTKKIKKECEKLQTHFPQIQWILFDEAFSSQMAQEIKPAFSKKEKLQSHAIAAAIILRDYFEQQKTEDY